TRLGVRPEHIRVVPNAIDVGAIRRQAAAGPVAPLPARAGGPTLLLPAVALRPNKGPEIAVAALAALPGAALWITGEADDPAGARHRAALEGLAERLGVADRVHLVGRRADVYAVMAAVDAVVVPSLVGEGFGLVAAEAMAVGTPVVVSNRGALPEVVEHGVSGLVVEAGDPAALAGALTRLAAEPGLTDRLVAGGRRRVEGSFDYGRWQREVADVLAGAASRWTVAGRVWGWRSAVSR
ncbi:MAG TPA: glycosyltransferase family 4 protein, partial [Thermomicrobiaceae bacterium]|nr:glycosyltransferase family 4 protein [Thermomicrobiaceae bacterium]